MRDLSPARRLARAPPRDLDLDLAAPRLDLDLSLNLSLDLSLDLSPDLSSDLARDLGRLGTGPVSAAICARPA